MRSTIRNAIAAAALAALAVPAAADTPVSGVGGLALSPDGSRLLAITESRGLYVLDPTTLEIQDRHWLRTSPVGIIYSADGERIFVRDTSDTVWVLKASDFSVEREIDDVKIMEYAPAANMLFVVEYEYDRDNRRNDSTIIAYQAASFEELGKVELDAEAAALAVAPDASVVAVLTDSFDIEGEPDEDKPDNMTSLEREIWDHKHDQEEATIFLITDRGQTVNSVNTWYSDFSQPTLKIIGDQVWVAPYSGMVARLDPSSGEAELIEVEGVSYNYGAAFSPDGKMLMVGGLRSIGTVMTDGSGPGLAFDVEQLPGWPEYMESFAAGADGSFYAGTSASVVRRIDASGNVTAEMPLF